jgi:hypothetical protein
VEQRQGGRGAGGAGIERNFSQHVGFEQATESLAAAASNTSPVGA